MSDETIQLLVDKKVPIVTTFSALVMQANPEIARKFAVPEWKILERQKAVADKSRFDGLVRASKAGVQIVFGTDAGSPAVEHDSIAPELNFMVEVGVCPTKLDALRAITIRAAKLSRMDHLIGTVEAGKAADLIVVDGKPDEDLFALERVTMTLIAGKRMH
jgi:imidazolonepropionase-like amidohydrolase